MSEQLYQNKLMVALCKHLPVRVWRQNSGKTLTAHQTVVKGAPKGAADITGLVTINGLRLEIECKLKGKKRSEAQLHWAEVMQASHAVYCLVEFDTDAPVDQEIARCVELVRAAIELRTGTTVAKTTEKPAQCVGTTWENYRYNPDQGGDW